MRKNIQIQFLVAFSLFLIACSSQESAWKGTIEEVDGVINVKNPNEPMYGEEIVVIEEDLSIGEAQGPEEYMLLSVMQVVVDEKNHIYISEFGGNTAHVKVFDDSGKYLRTIGRKGQGPGEFFQATSLQITPNNELTVWDRYTRKLAFFSLEGEYLRTQIFQGENLTGNIHLTPQGNYFVISIEMKKWEADNTFHVVNTLSQYGPDFAFIRTIANDRERTNTPFQAWMMIRLAASNSAICGVSENYEFQIYNSDGELTHRVFKDYNPVDINRGEKQRRELTKEKDLPGQFPAFQNYLMDENGWLFVQTYERYMDGDEFYFDVFDAEGKYLVKVPFKIFPKLWDKGKLYAIEEDEEGYKYIKRYKVTWKINGSMNEF